MIWHKTWVESRARFLAAALLVTAVNVWVIVTSERGMARFDIHPPITFAHPSPSPSTSPGSACGGQHWSGPRPFSSSGWALEGLMMAAGLVFFAAGFFWSSVLPSDYAAAGMGLLSLNLTFTAQDYLSAGSRHSACLIC